MLAMSAPIYKCMTKATTAEGDQMEHGPNWLRSRRARLKVFDDRLECGDWILPFSDIREAVLFRICSTLFIPGYVLRVQTEQRTYHFGLNAGSFWKGELPFAVKRETGKVGHSAFSIVLRVMLLGYLIYLIWLRVSSD